MSSHQLFFFLFTLFSLCFNSNNSYATKNRAKGKAKEVSVKSPECIINSKSELNAELNFNCDRKEFRDIGKTAQRVINLSRNIVSKKINLQKTVEKDENIFEVIRSSETGKKILDKFLPKYSSGEIQIKQFNPSNRQKLNSRTNAGAVFLYDGKVKTIYVDYKSELGVLAPLLLHEIVHSLDEDFINTYKKSKILFQNYKIRGLEILKQAAKRKNKSADEINSFDLNKKELSELKKLKDISDKFDDERSFKTERLAYNIHEKFIKELKRKFPCYDQYISAHSKKGHLIDRHLSDDDIIAEYQLNPEFFEKNKVSKPKNK